MIKIIVGIIFSVIVALGFAGPVSAVSFTEEYSGQGQAIFEPGFGPSSFYFGFDFFYLNSVRHVGTDSNLTLTQDAAGAFNNWGSASLAMTFSDRDWPGETASIELYILASDGTHEFSLGTLNFQVNSGSSVYSHVFNLTGEQVAYFSSNGLGNVEIEAVASGFNWQYNDFKITRVAMNVEATPVPEPGTIILIGMGLVGLGVLGRRKFRK